MARASSFVLPDELNAAAPPERRGLRRDHVPLMVLDRATGAAVHARFFELDRYLVPGDVLVANRSRTIPAVFQARTGAGAPVEVRLHCRRGERDWQALIRPPEAVAAGGELAFAGGLRAEVTWHAAVCSLERSERWYREAFGFAVAELIQWPG